MLHEGILDHLCQMWSRCPVAQSGVDEHQADAPAAINQDARQHTLRHPTRRDRKPLERGHHEPAHEHRSEDPEGEAEEEERPTRERVGDHGEQQAPQAAPEHLVEDRGHPEGGYASQSVDAALDQADTAEEEDHTLMEDHHGKCPGEEAEHHIAPS